MKRYVLILLAFAMTFSFSACVEKNEEAKDSAKEEVVAEDAETPAFQPVTGEWEEYAITIAGAEAFVDSDGKDAIRVYYDFTNNSQETTNAYAELAFAVEQDGYETETTYADYDNQVEEDENGSLNIRPGVSIRCVEEYFMKVDGGLLTFAVSNFWNEEERIEVQFDPKNLPGVPDYELTMLTVEDPQWIVGCPNEGLYDEMFYVVMEGIEVVDGNDGDPVLRVYYEFTNNSEEAANMWFSADPIVYQDGVELCDGFPAETVMEDGNYIEDIEPGETIRTSYCYKLKSSNPVEIELADSWTGEVIGMVCAID